MAVTLNLAHLISLLTVVVAAWWTYTKFIVERQRFPSVEFNIDCQKIGQLGERWVLEVRLCLNNVGTTTLRVHNLRLDVRYQPPGQNSAPAMPREERLYEDQLYLRENHQAGRLYFPLSLIKEMGISPENLVPNKMPKGQQSKGPERRETKEKKSIPNECRGFLVLEDDTYVQPGVCQVYTFITTVPRKTQGVLLWGAFQHIRSTSQGRWFQRLLRKSIKQTEIAKNELKNVSKPHTAERTYWFE